MIFSNLWLRLFFSFGIIAVTAALFSLVGGGWLKRSWREDLPFSFRMANGYFLGSCVFLLLWKALALLTQNAQLSLGVTYVALILICVALRSAVWQDARCLLRGLPLFFTLFFCVTTISLLLWIRASDGRGGIVFDGMSLGSASTLTYSNIALSLFSTNRMPVLAKHYDQSLLAAVPLFFGVAAIFVNFLLWVGMTTTALGYQVYGLLRWLRFRMGSSWLGAVIVLLGNTALSLNHVLILDSQNPFLWMGYSDTVRAFGTILLFAAALSQWSWRPLKFHPLMYTFIPMLLTWPSFGAQNSLLVIGFFLCLYVFSLVVGENLRSFCGLACLLSLLLTILGAGLGGMFTPRRLTTDSTVMNQLSSPKPVFCPYFIHPMSVGHFASEAGWSPKLKNCGDFGIMRIDSFEAFAAAVYQIEENAWSGLRALFWPIAALIGLFFWIRGDRIQEERKTWLTHFSLLTVFFILAGFAFAFFIGVQNGADDFRKGELARFLIPGYGAGMVAVALWLISWKGESGGPKKMAATGLFCAFLCLPPVVSTVFRFRQNFISPELIGWKWRCFVSPGHPVNQPEPLAQCETLSNAYFQRR